MLTLFPRWYIDLVFDLQLDGGGGGLPPIYLFIWHRHYVPDVVLKIVTKNYIAPAVFADVCICN